MKKYILLSLCLILINCASVGRKLDVNQVDKIKEGQSVQEIITLIGSPDSKTTSTDIMTGQPYEIWIYQFMTYRSSPVNFVPVVGMFAGSSNMQHEMLTLTFDNEGKLKSKQFYQAQNNINTGVLTSPETNLPEVQENKRAE